MCDFRRLFSNEIASFHCEMQLIKMCDQFVPIAVIYEERLYGNRNVDNQNVDKPKGRQTETSTDRNVDRPKCRETKTSTNRNVDRPKSTDQNIDKPKRRQTETSTNQNVDRPKRKHSTVLYCMPWCSRLFVFIIREMHCMFIRTEMLWDVLYNLVPTIS